MSTSCKKKYVIKVDPLTRIGVPGPTGPQGPAADPNDLLPISTDDVLYGTEVLTDVLDSLLYVPLNILNFIASPTIFENGVVLTSISLLWAYNKLVESQSISGTNVVPPTLAPTERNKIVTVTNISTDTIVTLTADDVDSDMNAALTADVTLHFTDKIYWGLAMIPGAIDSAFILSLTGTELRDDGIKSFNITTGVDEYIWFCLPDEYAEVGFKTNGFDGGFYLDSTISFTNASGATKSYKVYRSTNHTLGFTNVETYMI